MYAHVDNTHVHKILVNKLSLLSHLCIYHFEKFVKSGLAQSCLYLHDNLTGCFLSFFFTTFGKNPFAVMSKVLGLK